MRQVKDLGGATKFSTNGSARNRNRETEKHRKATSKGFPNLDAVDLLDNFIDSALKCLADTRFDRLWK
jgi:hypothetical protein